MFEKISSCIKQDKDGMFSVNIHNELKVYTKNKDSIKKLCDKLSTEVNDLKYVEYFFPGEMHFSKFMSLRRLVESYNVGKENLICPVGRVIAYVTTEKGESQIVRGVGLGEFMCLRNELEMVNGKEEVVHKIDSIVSGKPIFKIRKNALKFDFTVEHAKKFIEVISEKYQLDDEKVVSNMVDHNGVRTEMKRIFVEIFKRKEKIELDLRVFRQFQYHIYKTILSERYIEGEERDYDIEKEKEKVYVDTMISLDKMVGLNDVKKQFESIYKRVIADELLKKEGFESKQVNNNALFLGNAGTGKTVVARMYADILWALGVSNKERKLIEVSREDLISSSVGGSEEKTEEYLQEATGGVFFLDEAYSLLKESGSNDVGDRILTVLLRKMENDRENTTFILAGYEEEMLDLLNMNQGLDSRINKRYFFNDYSIEEITEIIINNLEETNLKIVGSERNIESLVRDKSSNGKVEGNARTARNISERIYNVKRDRIADGLSYNHLAIDPETIEEVRYGRGGSGNLEIELAEARRELDELIGLREVKNQVNNWVNSVMVKNIRFERGLNSSKPNLHMTFEGNPGTGKTIVARLMGKILKGSGILRRGNVVEVSRADLVGRYQGHTATNTKRVFDRAKGGVLFIDEAYSLLNSSRDSFGKEAIDTIIQEMENNRDNMVVIFAGYPDMMEDFLSFNPGMMSRISQRIHFEDYNPDELVNIFKLNAKKNDYELSEGALEEIKEYVFYMDQSGNIEGNGRWIRELVEKTITAQNNRILLDYDSLTDQELISIEREDVVEALGIEWREIEPDFDITIM